VDFALADALYQIIRTFNLRAVQKHLELECEVAADIPEMVVGDPTRLRQIVNNLWATRSSSPSAAKIAVKAELESREAIRCCCTSTVRDPASASRWKSRRRFSKAFSQADGIDHAQVRRYGSGGSPFRCALVHLMGGAMWVESQPGQGSCFHFTRRAWASRS